MSLEDHKTEIMAALKKQSRGKLKLRNEEEAWNAIKAAVVNIQKDRKRYEVEALNDPTGKARRDHYDKLIKNIEAARASFRTLRADPHMLEPMGLAEGQMDGEEQVWVDWELVEQGLAGAAKFLEVLTDWIERAGEEAKKAVLSHRPVSPVTRTLDRLAFSLGLIYADQRRKLPGLSMGGTNPTPFDNFMSAVAKAMDLKVKGPEIKRAIKRLDVKNNRWFHESLNEPPRDTSRSAAETFGHLIDKLVH
jgi:hypothetical protein